MRSGTTVLHALACTAPESNTYVAECSYFSGLVRAMAHGVHAWDLHTRFYFPDLNAFAQYHAGLVRKVVEDIWVYLGRPKLLTLKDPLLTPHFSLVAQLLPRSRFVVAARDPRAVVASRVSAARRAGETVTDALLENYCADYVNSYAPLLRGHPALAGRLLVVSYERLVAGGEIDRLTAFGITGIAPARLWQDAITPPDAYHGAFFDSCLYGKPMSDSAVEHYREVLDKDQAVRVMERCGATFRALLERRSP